MRIVGKHLRARAARTLVYFNDHGVLVKTHPRQSTGGRSIDPSDFPVHKSAYAMRHIACQVARHGAAIVCFARHALEGPFPWTGMRSVYALLGLMRRYGERRVEQTCRLALDAPMYDVRRLGRILQAAPAVARTTPPSPATPAPAPHLRPASQYSSRSTHAITDQS